MKTTKLVALLITMIAAPALAALPPWVERGREIAAVAQDPGVLELTGTRLIEEVRYVDADQYEVVAEGCTVQVQLETESSQAIGPRQFSVHVTGSEGCE